MGLYHWLRYNHSRILCIPLLGPLTEHIFGPFCWVCRMRLEKENQEYWDNLKCNNSHDTAYCQSCSVEDDNYPFKVYGQWIEHEINKNIVAKGGTPLPPTDFSFYLDQHNDFVKSTKKYRRP